MMAPRDAYATVENVHPPVATPVFRQVLPAWLGWTLGILLGAWLLLPLPFSQHLEGYTANLRSITIAWERGELATQDTYLPLLTPFLFYTRLGMVFLLRGIDAVFGGAGDAGLRGLVIASLLAMMAAAVAAARAWSGLPWWCLLLPLLLIPGLTEIGFFFNDNVVSAAFGIMALALVSWRDRPAAFCGGGALLAAAVLCRTDAALLLPLLGGIAWRRHAGLAPLLPRAAATVLGFALVLVGGFAISGATPLDGLRIAAPFVPVSGGWMRLHMTILFFGTVGLPLCTIGVVLGLRRHLLRLRDLKWCVVFVLYPGCVVALGVLRLATEMRYLYPLLAPVYLMHAGLALRWLALQLGHGGRARTMAGALVAALVLTMLLPPLTIVRDGPHAFSGRLWMPFLWLRWQRSVAQSLEQVDALVSKATSAERTLVLSTHFNDDFYLKLRLFEAGFHPVPVDSVLPGCRQGFSVYARPGQVVLHIRTDNQYGLVKLPPVTVRALQIRRALRCPGIWRFDQAFLTMVGSDSRTLPPPLDPALFGAVLPRVGDQNRLSRSFALGPIIGLPPGVAPWPDAATPKRLWFGEIHVLPIPVETLRGIAESAEAIAAAAPLEPGHSAFSDVDFDRIYARPEWLDAR